MFPPNNMLLCDYNIHVKRSVHQLLKSLPCVSSFQCKAQNTDEATVEFPVLLQAFNHMRPCHGETFES